MTFLGISLDAGKNIKLNSDESLINLFATATKFMAV